jgi:hypothetical protein
MRLPVREDVLSDFARSKFAAHGRGAVVIQERGVLETIAGEQYGTVLAYMYEGSTLLEQVGGRWPGTTRLAVETYDPEREMVVIVLYRNDDLEAFLLPLTTSA